MINVKEVMNSMNMITVIMEDVTRITMESTSMTPKIIMQLQKKGMVVVWDIRTMGQSTATTKILTRLLMIVLHIVLLATSISLVKKKANNLLIIIAT